MTYKVNDIDQLSQELAHKLAQAKTHQDVEAIRIFFLGKNGVVPSLLEQLKAASLEEKKTWGAAVQAFKNAVAEKIASCKEAITQEQETQKLKHLQGFDVTAYTPGQPKGHLHPFSIFLSEVHSIFLSMGYEIWDGPEFETEHYNFNALNVPQDHPARDMQDTFWTNKPGYLLRTQTSPIQVRAMQNRRPPLAGIAPGRTYRNEAVDATHDFMFMQCEGLLVDKNVTLANLFAVSQTFLKTLFDKKNLDIRIRPGFFPFVEPGVEIDMRCVFCKSGCSVCKQSTWIEVFPGGLVHPNVLKAGHINPQEYSGFAFGFGLTRLVMLRYGIDDIRLLYSGKTKFLEQF